MTGFPLLPPMDVAWKKHEEGEIPQMIWVDAPMSIRNKTYLIGDEINRIPQMTQNKWFSLVAERRIDGINTDIKGLVGAMNPVEDYEGTEPLDHAFADRFTLLIRPPSFRDLSFDDRIAVAMSRLNVNDNGIRFGKEITDESARGIYNIMIAGKVNMRAVGQKEGYLIGKYATLMAQQLYKSHYELEGRRVSSIVQAVAALAGVNQAMDGEYDLAACALEIMLNSIVTTAYGEDPPEDSTIEAAHEEHKHVLMTQDDVIGAVMSEMSTPLERVGASIFLGVDQERLTDTIQASLNELSARSKSEAAAFSYVLLDRLRHHDVKPHRHVIDECAAYVNLLVDQRGLSIKDVLVDDDAQRNSLIELVSSMKGNQHVYDEVRNRLAILINEEWGESSKRSNTSLTLSAGAMGQMPALIVALDGATALLHHACLHLKPLYQGK